jgi:predicted transcriptional regulator
MGNTAKGKATISAEVPESLRDRLDARAAQEKRSRSETVGRAIAFFLEFAQVEPAAPPVVEVPKPKKK